MGSRAEWRRTGQRGLKNGQAGGIDFSGNDITHWMHTLNDFNDDFNDFNDDGLKHLTLGALLNMSVIGRRLPRNRNWPKLHSKTWPNSTRVYCCRGPIYDSCTV
jgi:hypothetical protein